MSNSLHTPGPWVRDQDQQLRGADGSLVIVYMHGLTGVSKCEKAQANSALIETAPELLEALQEFLNYCDTAHENPRPFDLSKARALIAKAGA